MLTTNCNKLTGIYSLWLLLYNEHIFCVVGCIVFYFAYREVSPEMHVLLRNGN